MTEEEKRSRIVSVEDFKNYFELGDCEIPDDYIDEFIDHYRITYSFMESTSYKQTLIDSYNDTQIGYSISNKINGPKTDEPLETFVRKTDYIFIQFQFQPRGRDVSIFRGMVIDFRHMMIYFGSDMGNYSLSEYSAPLSQLEKERICEGITEHINPNIFMGNVIDGAEYSFKVWFIDASKNHKCFTGFEGDEENFPGFDKYFKMDLFEWNFKTEFTI